MDWPTCRAIFSKTHPVTLLTDYVALKQHLKKKKRKKRKKVKGAF
jgi:ornithine carbamoyltransferase